jgi:hypothetical protein
MRRYEIMKSPADLASEREENPMKWNLVATPNGSCMKKEIKLKIKTITPNITETNTILFNRSLSPLNKVTPRKIKRL